MAQFLEISGLDTSFGQTILIGETLPENAETLLPTEEGCFLKMPVLETESVLNALNLAVLPPCDPNPGDAGSMSGGHHTINMGKLILFPYGAAHAELAVRLSVRRNGTSMTDVQELSFPSCVPEQQEPITVRRKIFSGHILGSFQLRRAPFFLSLAKGLPESDPVGGTLGETVDPGTSDSGAASHFVAEERIFHPETREYGLEDAPLVIAGGRGLKSRANAEELMRLASQIGAASGGTRPAVMNAWFPLDRLIGVSGTQIRPKLCIVCAASGAPAFYSGIEASKTIIAVNNDESAPIMKKADACVCADWKEILTELSKLCQH